jgi:hypothetical protein
LVREGEGRTSLSVDDPDPVLHVYSWPDGRLVSIKNMGWDRSMSDLLDGGFLLYRRADEVVEWLQMNGLGEVSSDSGHQWDLTKLTEGGVPIQRPEKEGKGLEVSLPAPPHWLYSSIERRTKDGKRYILGSVAPSGC